MKILSSLFLAAAALFMVFLSASATASTLDERIESAARDSYVFKTFLKGDDIRIESKDGRVVLTGTVAERSHIGLAGDTILGLPGVRTVDNRRSVQDGPGEVSDLWIREKVKFTLLIHRNVSATKTEVDVRNGVVTLRGSAASQAQKELTAEYVRDVDGVKSVENKMGVSESGEAAPRTMGDRIDDASITAQVKLALLFHRATSALRTTVTTEDGVVTVAGEARNPAEKDLVTKLAEDVNGVRSVVNSMTVGN